MGRSGAFRHANNTVSAHGAVAVTASDTTDLPVTRAIYIGGTGNIAIVMPDHNLDLGASAAAAQALAVVFSNVSAGTILPVQAVRVLSTGTTATNIVALY
jgi:hypothetical protein